MKKPAYSSSSSRQDKGDGLKIEALPAFPAVAARALKVSNDPTSSAADMERVISYDPALAGRVLSIANSAYYGFRHNVTTIRQAVVLLGISTVRSAVVSASCYGVFARAGMQAELESLWLHSIGTAIAAERLAKRARVLPSDEAYLAGLLHDVGVAAIAISFPGVVERIKSVSSQRQISRLSAEREVLGYDHSYVGTLVTREWGMPGSIVCAAAHHHSPAEATDVPEAAACVHIADVIASRLGFALDPTMAQIEPDSGAASALGLMEGEIEQISEQIAGSVEEIRQMAAEMGGWSVAESESRGETAA